MRILVTGGAGYIGSVSVEAFLAAGHEVTVLDDLSTGHREAVPAGAKLEVASYADSSVVTRLVHASGIEAVLHCAAKSLVGESMTDPAKYYRENVAGAISLIDALHENGVGRFVLSSTAAVYGIPQQTPITETDPVAPINTYGETKRTIEGMLRWYGQAYGLRSVALRYFNAAGASRANGEQHSPETHLIPNVLRAVEEDREIVLFGDDYPTPDGTCIRDYIHVEDLADAHLLALQATAADDRRTGPPEGPVEPLICNLGSGRGFSNREVVAAAERGVGRPIPVGIGPRRAGDPPVLVASADRAREVLGWTPHRGTLAEMIGSAWAWRQTHPGGHAA